ncbi:hypothetical protein ACQI4E_29530 [Streptomyces sp. CA-252508]|uniref:hypothetical protein n=1 Tax=Streptomyces sp. CA-252508 TaxID=3418946 RepID=UPI003D89ECC5
MFTYVAADGVARTYRIKRQLLGIHLIHDPRKPHVAAHVSLWYFVAARLFLVLAAGIGTGALGGTVSFHTAWLPDTEYREMGTTQRAPACWGTQADQAPAASVPPTGVRRRAASYRGRTATELHPETRPDNQEHAHVRAASLAREPA